MVARRGPGKVWRRSSTSSTRRPGSPSSSRSGTSSSGADRGLGNHTLLIARDGSERPIDDSAAPISESDGQVVGVVLIFRDITERRQSRAAHRRRPGNTPRASSPRCVSRSSSSTPTCTSARRIAPSTDVPGLARRDRRPIHLRPGGWPMGYPGIQDAAGGNHPRKQPVRRLAGGARFRVHRPEDDDAQCPPLSPRRRNGS